jgi:hypothetical protein
VMHKTRRSQHRQEGQRTEYALSVKTGPSGFSRQINSQEKHSPHNFSPHKTFNLAQL